MTVFDWDKATVTVKIPAVGTTSVVIQEVDVSVGHLGALAAGRHPQLPAPDRHAKPAHAKHLHETYDFPRQATVYTAHFDDRGLDVGVHVTVPDHMVAVYGPETVATALRAIAERISG